MAAFILKMRNVKKREGAFVVEHIDVEAHVERSQLMPNEPIDMASPAAQVMLWTANNLDYIINQIRKENSHGKDLENKQTSEAGSVDAESGSAGRKNANGNV